MGRDVVMGLWADPEYVRAYQRDYYCRSNEREQNRQYYGKYRRTRYVGYFGAVTCPKCGKHGYAYLKQSENVKTRVVYTNPFLQVLHIHKKHGKTVYDGICFIGVVHNE
jgi:hypothetical protein